MQIFGINLLLIFYSFAINFNFQNSEKVYAATNAEVLTFHEVPLVQITSNPGWIEFDPVDIWKCVVECIKIGTKNLIILDINPANIIAIGITNQRETTVLWHKTDGMPLCNAIGK